MVVQYWAYCGYNIMKSHFVTRNVKLLTTIP